MSGSGVRLAAVAWLWDELDATSFAIHKEHTIQFPALDAGADTPQRLTDLGILEPVNASEADAKSKGVIVRTVADDTPAKRAHMERRDLITHQ